MRKLLILIFAFGIVFLLPSCASEPMDEDLTSNTTTTENQISADQYLYMNAFAICCADKSLVYVHLFVV